MALAALVFLFLSLLACFLLSGSVEASFPIMVESLAAFAASALEEEASFPMDISVELLAEEVAAAETAAAEAAAAAPESFWAALAAFTASAFLEEEEVSFRMGISAERA